MNRLCARACASAIDPRLLARDAKKINNGTLSMVPPLLRPPTLAPHRILAERHASHLHRIGNSTVTLSVVLVLRYARTSLYPATHLTSNSSVWCLSLLCRRVSTHLFGSPSPEQQNVTRHHSDDIRSIVRRK